MPPITDADREAYAEKLQDIIDRFEAMEVDTIARVMNLIEELRDRIIAEISMATTTGSDFRFVHFEQLRQSVERQLAIFESQFWSLTSDRFNQAVAMGDSSFTDPIAAAGIVMTLPYVDRSILNTVLDYDADLINGISADLRKKIVMQINLTALGQQSPMEAMENVTQSLGIERKFNKYLTKGIAWDAERIVRTELNRLYNLAHYTQGRAFTRVEPDMEKSWIATPDNRTRLTHLEAHKTYAKDPIPFEDLFDVGRAKLRFPHDPSGPPEEVINCRCHLLHVHPLVGRFKLEIDDRIEAEINSRKGGE